jgi:hypothetical protein
MHAPMCGVASAGHATEVTKNHLIENTRSKPRLMGNPCPLQECDTNLVLTSLHSYEIGNIIGRKRNGANDNRLY